MKIFLIVISIVFIIGLFWFIIKKSKFSKYSTIFQLKKKLPFKINNLINDLGGKGNILEIDAKLSKIKINLKNPQMINAQAIKEKGASGIVLSSTGVILIFGVISVLIAQELKKHK